MIFYCITYDIHIELKENTQKRFFCFAKDEKQATIRFCETTGRSSKYIISIRKVD